MSEATYPKTADEMYADLAGIQEGGSLYPLKRTEPLTIEYLERVSRTSTESPDLSKDKVTVYLTSNGGKEYRIVVDCATDRVAFEHVKDGGWQTYSNALSGFRYRSPQHPEREQGWPYDGQ
jgi:hypothetical protein